MTSQVQANNQAVHSSGYDREAQHQRRIDQALNQAISERQTQQGEGATLTTAEIRQIVLSGGDVRR